VASEFRDLDAYRRAVALAHQLHSAVERWPPLDRQTVGPQLIRALTSIGANTAEASGRWHEQDRRRFLWIARGSLHETEHWIIYAEEPGLLERGTSDRIAEIAKPLNGLIKRRRSWPALPHSALCTLHF
jgi:four helix bundle protein